MFGFEFGCHTIECKNYREAEIDETTETKICDCKVYGGDGMLLRMRLGYCPIIDKYFNPTVQAAKEKAHKLSKGRVGQQKQRR